MAVPPGKPAATNSRQAERSASSKMTYLSAALAVLFAGVAIRAYNHVAPQRYGMPAQAQFISQKAFNVLPYVLPPSEFNLTNVSRPFLGRDK